MHFDFTITLQGILTIGVVIAGFVRIERKMIWFLIEHEILIDDWQTRNPNAKLPTRARHGRS
jgi:hypothetical protein